MRKRRVHHHCLKKPKSSRRLYIGTKLHAERKLPRLSSRSIKSGSISNSYLRRIALGKVSIVGARFFFTEFPCGKLPELRKSHTARFNTFFTLLLRLGIAPHCVSQSAQSSLWRAGFYGMKSHTKSHGNAGTIATLGKYRTIS